MSPRLSQVRRRWAAAAVGILLIAAGLAWVFGQRGPATGADSDQIAARMYLDAVAANSPQRVQDIAVPGSLTPTEARRALDRTRALHVREVRWVRDFPDHHTAFLIGTLNNRRHREPLLLTRIDDRWYVAVRPSTTPPGDPRKGPGTTVQPTQ